MSWTDGKAGATCGRAGAPCGIPPAETGRPAHEAREAAAADTSANPNNTRVNRHRFETQDFAKFNIARARIDGLRRNQGSRPTTAIALGDVRWRRATSPPGIFSARQARGRGKARKIYYIQ
jgi:hypothetical protein